MSTRPASFPKSIIACACGSLHYEPQVQRCPECTRGPLVRLLWKLRFGAKLDHDGARWFLATLAVMALLVLAALTGHIAY